MIKKVKFLICLLTKKLKTKTCFFDQTHNEKSQIHTKEKETDNSAKNIIFSNAEKIIDWESQPQETINEETKNISKNLYSYTKTNFKDKYIRNKKTFYFGKFLNHFIQVTSECIVIDNQPLRLYKEIKTLKNISDQVLEEKKDRNSTVQCFYVQTSDRYLYLVFAKNYKNITIKEKKNYEAELNEKNRENIQLAQENSCLDKNVISDNKKKLSTKNHSTSNMVFQKDYVSSNNVSQENYASSNFFSQNNHVSSNISLQNKSLPLNGTRNNISERKILLDQKKDNTNLSHTHKKSAKFVNNKYKRSNNKMSENILFDENEFLEFIEITCDLRCFTVSHNYLMYIKKYKLYIHKNGKIVYVGFMKFDQTARNILCEDDLKNYINHIKNENQQNLYEFSDRKNLYFRNNIDYSQSKNKKNIYNKGKYTTEQNCNYLAHIENLLKNENYNKKIQDHIENHYKLNEPKKIASQLNTDEIEIISQQNPIILLRSSSILYIYTYKNQKLIKLKNDPVKLAPSIQNFHKSLYKNRECIMLWPEKILFTRNNRVFIHKIDKKFDSINSNYIITKHMFAEFRFTKNVDPFCGYVVKEFPLPVDLEKIIWDNKNHVYCGVSKNFRSYVHNNFEKDIEQSCELNNSQSDQNSCNSILHTKKDVFDTQNNFCSRKSSVSDISQVSKDINTEKNLDSSSVSEKDQIIDSNSSVTSKTSFSLVLLDKTLDVLDTFVLDDNEYIGDYKFLMLNDTQKTELLPEKYYSNFLVVLANFLQGENDLVKSRILLFELKNVQNENTIFDKNNPKIYSKHDIIDKKIYNDGFNLDLINNEENNNKTDNESSKKEFLDRNFTENTLSQNEYNKNINKNNIINENQNLKNMWLDKKDQNNAFIKNLKDISKNKLNHNSHSKQTDTINSNIVYQDKNGNLSQKFDDLNENIIKTPVNNTVTSEKRYNIEDNHIDHNLNMIDTTNNNYNNQNTKTRVDYKGQTHKAFKLLACLPIKSSAISCDSIRGNLVIGQGTRLMIYKIDRLEGLVAIAFHDLSIIAVSLSVIKNFILVGDLLRGVTFFYFQTRPVKIIKLSFSEPIKNLTMVHIYKFNTIQSYKINTKHHNYNLSSNDKKRRRYNKHLKKDEPKNSSQIPHINKCELSLCALYNNNISIYTYSPNNVLSKNGEILIKRADACINDFIIGQTNTFLYSNYLLYKVAKIDDNPATKMLQRNSFVRFFKENVMLGYYNIFKMQYKHLNQITTKPILDISALRDAWLMDWKLKKELCSLLNVNLDDIYGAL
ncbi:hypothetical protein EDEG_02863 [Edhazardia aedis USNM 41457]|uniref:RSE1/DDB1/CPSF1 C-terminal domain-containing protein n=1 Tax=Edhazardia aedis (strain USNM 41457) TaxID=1003232 RepID=J9DN04_EDHAE|nr:hypothetical protein EDEG_02863 [Edhazardia aedis USNM 41457]|eukprot:EJW02742.1 hypothetical protein EDEG_02863 [Edhazardia aedis USNM 41457]